MRGLAGFSRKYNAFVINKECDLRKDPWFVKIITRRRRTVSVIEIGISNPTGFDFFLTNHLANYYQLMGFDTQNIISVHLLYG